MLPPHISTLRPLPTAALLEISDGGTVGAGIHEAVSVCFVVFEREETMEKTRAVKVQFGDDIRRFSLPDESFETLRAIIQDAFPEIRATKEWKIKYKDEDGGMLNISIVSKII